MALFIKQQDDRTELQNRLAIELQERAKQRAKDADLPDGVSDSQYIEDTKQTTSLAWVWAILIIITAVIIIWLISIGVAK